MLKVLKVMNFGRGGAVSRVIVIWRDGPALALGSGGRRKDLSLLIHIVSTHPYSDLVSAAQIGIAPSALNTLIYLISHHGYTLADSGV